MCYNPCTVRLPSRSLFFLAGAVAVLAGTAVAKSLVPVFLPAVSLSNLFPDVEEGTYFTESVGDLVRKGILKGYEDGRFGPHDFVTRAQVAVMLDRYDREVVEPLREQLAKIRELLKLGRCGDGSVQIGEECDDENIADNDGCSATCQSEVHAEGRPEPMQPEGGCKVAGCSRQLCVPEGSEDVVTTCEWRPEYACYQQAVCERQEDGGCGWTETPELRSCLAEAGGDDDACAAREEDLSRLLRASRACRTSDDCRVLVRGCSPYLTCGQPVNKANFETVQAAIEEYVTSCPEEGPMTCAACVERQAVCERGLCRLDPPLRCSGEARTCPDGTEVRRNPDFDCDFDPCPEEALQEESP